MKKLFEASTIAIIGGADGPTSIYVSSGAKWQLILILLIFIFFFIFGIIRLIQNIKKHKPIRIVVWSVILFLMISIVVLNQAEKKHYENILQSINAQQSDFNDYDTEMKCYE